MVCVHFAFTMERGAEENREKYGIVTCNGGYTGYTSFIGLGLLVQPPDADGKQRNGDLLMFTNVLAHLVPAIQMNHSPGTDAGIAELRLHGHPAPATPEKYVVLDSKAKMPSSCWGTYRRVAVVETNGKNWPMMIHPRHKAVVRIVATWERLFAGKSDKCAYAVALAKAEKLAAEMNAAAADDASQN